MGLDFLARVRRTSLLAGLVAALIAGSSFTLVSGLGVAAGAAWSLLNLVALESIVTGLVGARLGRDHSMRSVALGAAGTLALFIVGALLLTQLPTIALMVGFLIPFAVLVLKASSLLLLQSSLWRRITANPWQAAGFLAVVIAASWFAATGTHGVLRASAEEPHSTTQAAAPAGQAHATEGEHAAAGAHAAVGEHAEAAGPKMFDNVLGVIIKANHGKPWANFLHHFEYVIYAMIVAVILSIIFITAARNPQMVPGPLQNVIEAAVEAAYNFFVSILGPKYGPRFVPFLGTLFIYVWAMNFFGTIPMMHSPTANLNITVAMALTVFGYVQFTAFKELGFMGWLDHMAGSPRSAIGWALVPLMMPVHLIGELAKPISLSCRLFGNIFGEDMLLVGFATLGITALSSMHMPFGLPLQLPFMFLGVLITQPVQALVFTMLSTVYFLLMLPHGDHGHGHEGEAHHNAH
jgi:F-type H+-transporting ATPase subunit a